MSNTIDVRVPDLGDFHDVPVIEVLVKPGDTVKKDDALITLESEKASMEVPSSAAGVVKDVKVAVGDKVSKDTVIVSLASESAEADGAAVTGKPSASAGTIELRVPDLGDFHDVPVIEVLVKPGDRVEREAPLVTLESEKASMDVPASSAGTIQDVLIKSGDKVSKGTLIATLSVKAEAAAAKPPEPPTPSKSAAGTGPQDAGEGSQPRMGDRPKDGRTVPQDAGEGSEPRMGDRPKDGRTVHQDAGEGSEPRMGDRPKDGRTVPQDAGEGSEPRMGDRPKDGRTVHASPAIRRFARELGVDLHGVGGTGPRGRVTREDVQGFVKRALAGGAAAGGAASPFNLPAWPNVDFAQYGAIERKPLPRIKKISGPNLHRNWLQIPHITNYDEADVTDLEAFRVEVNAEQTKSNGPKVTMLAFLIKACVAALQRFPEFNSSLEGDELVYKRYYNIGFAADTPGGLVVPVLKNADRKGLLEIARESAELAGKARDGKLGMADMQGGSFTISSIGGIGGTQFTQIVNAPEVAILGATRAAVKPVWDGTAFVPRTILPVSVSYDHRVIDGAGAARFLVYVTSLLRDFRRVLL